jgi:hypothetical protein
MALPVTLGAQSAARPVNARAATSVQNREAGGAREWMSELQRIQGRLQAAHNRVMQDASMRSAQEGLMRDVKVAMLRIDPGLDALAHQVESMQTQAAAAQQRGDMRTLQQLNAQLAPIQQRFLRAQQQVMQQPGIVARARQLEQQLHQRMLQVEPETDRLLERGRVLQVQLVRAQQGQAQAGPRND